MCGSKGGGSPPVPGSASTAFQSTSSPTPFAQSLYTDFLNRANALSNTPFNPAMMGSVAPMNTQQTAAGNQLFNLGMSAGNFDPSQVKAIESPYIQDVVGATQGWFNNQNAIQGQDLMSQAIRSGNAFGGDRAGVAEGVLAGQQQLAQAPVIAGLYQSGYTQALNEYNQLKQMGLQGAGAALGWGSLQQQQQQRELDVAQQNAMMQSAYPFQTMNWYGSALGGIAPLTGSQVVGYNTPPDPNSTGQIIGGAAAGLGLVGSAFGSAGGPASGVGSGSGFRRGGFVAPRPMARGGLVPVVLARSRGGLVAIPLQFGGSADQRDDEDTSRDDDRPSKSDRDYGYTENLPQTEGHRTPSRPDFGYGQLQGGARSVPQPVFPGGTTQPQQSTAQQVGSWLDVGKKAVDVGSKLLPALALLKGGGWVIPHLANGSGVDIEDSSYDPNAEPPPDEGPPAVEESPAGPVPLPRARPNPPMAMGEPRAGRMTWFNPRPYTYTDPNTGRVWTDTGAQGLREGPHASGLPIGTPGFASPGSRGLGHWYEVTTPDGQKQIIQKTDVGPPGVIDLNAAAASRAYPGGPTAVPSGRATTRYIGAQLPPDVKATAPAGSTASAGPEGPRDPDADVQPGEGRGGYTSQRLPRELMPPERTFAQRWSANPLAQFGASMLAQRSPYLGVNLGNAMLGTMGMQEQQRKQDILDAKPQMIETEKGIGWRVGDKFFQTSLRSPGAADKEWQRRTEQPFATEEEVPGPFGSVTKTKKYWTHDDQGNVVPFQQPGAAAGPPSTRQNVVTPPASEEEPPAQAPQAPQAPQGTGAAPAEAPGSAPQQGQPPAQEAPPAVQQRPAGPQRQTQDTGQPAPPVPVGGRTGGTQLPQVAQAGPAGPAAAQPYSFEDAYRQVKPAGTITDPQASAVGRNENVLQGLRPDEQRIVKGIADYSIDPNKVFAGKQGTELRRHAIDKVMEYDPSYNAANYPARAQALKEYGVNGQAQKSLQSNTMVLEHIGDTMTAVDKLENSTVPIYNKLTGQWLYQTGDPKYQAAFKAFKTASEAAATEAAKTFRGVGSMSQREQQLWSEIVGNAYDSPVGLRSALKELTTLVQGRLNATANGYNQAMGPSYYRDGASWMTPKALETIGRARANSPQENQPFAPSRYSETKGSGPGGMQEGPQGPQGQGGGQPQAPVQVQSIDEARKLRPGTQFIIPDGSGRIGTVPGAP